MNRIQAFEFNERPECPAILQESLVEILGNGLRWGHVYDNVGALFEKFCQVSGIRTVLDICSGSGEPVSILIDALEHQGVTVPQFVVSDLLPNISAMEKVAARHPQKVGVIQNSVDATNVPESLMEKNMGRTIISAFHHFPPELAHQILKDSIEKKQPIFILETFPRDLKYVLSVLPALASAWMFNPLFTRKNKFLKGIASPLLVPMGLWDTIISVLRIYAEPELREMVRFSNKTWNWEYHELPFFPFGKSVVFFGYPIE